MVGQSDWLPMMMATGLADMRACPSAPAEKKAPYRGTHSAEASRYDSLTISGRSWVEFFSRSGTMKGSPARSRAMPARLRAAAARPVREEAEPRTAQPARNIPSELAVLLGEVQRLEGELAAARSKMKELEASADIDAVTGIFN